MPASREDKNECDEQSLSKTINLTEVAESKSTILASILDREIKKEITIRRCDLETIEYRIYQTRQNLAKIRQGVVSDYYRQNYKGILQLPPHPAVKDTFHGKCPTSRGNLNNIKNDQTKVEADKSDFDTSNKEHDNQNGCDSTRKVENLQISKMPRYIPPNYRDKDIVRSSEPRGNVKKKKFRITIGNVSKWIFDKTSVSKTATHKWTVYVTCNDQEVEITSFISKVTFFLHNSYKPNDVITVDYAPFKLTRRGWGEFPLRVQLHFVNSLDKPVDVIHLLKLDTTHSGLETFGCETIVDVWAHCNEYYTVNNNESSDIIDRFPTVGLQKQQQPVLADEPTTDLSDSYLNASSLSMISMPTEITNEIISEILGDNHDDCGDISIKEEVVDNAYSLPATSSSNNKSAGDENSWNDDCNLTIKEEIVNDISVASTSAATSESEDKSWFMDVEKSFHCKSDMVEENLHENIVHTLENSAMTEKDFKQNEEMINQRTASVSSDYSFTEQYLTCDSIASVEADTTEHYYNQFQDILSENNTTIRSNDAASNNDLDATHITYNPIECLNFVQDEVVVKTEEVEDDEELATVMAGRQSINENGLSCNDYLENFMNSKIKTETSVTQSFEKLGKKQNKMMNESENTLEVSSAMDESQSYQQIKNNTPLTQEINITNQILKFNDNKSCEFNFLNNNGCGNLIINNITQHLDKLDSNQLTNIQNIKNNTVCLNDRITLSINNKPNLFNVKNTENLIPATNKNICNKILVKDLNSLGCIVISPTKTNLSQIKVSNININNNNNKYKNETITLLKNNEIKNLAKDKTVFNKNNFTSLNKSNSNQPSVLAGTHCTNSNSVNQQLIKSQANEPLYKKKFFVEMPNGQLKEIRSAISLNDCKLTPSSKPIIIESQPVVGKRKFYHTVSPNAQEFSVWKFNEPADKKVLALPGCRIVPSGRANSQNEQSYPIGRVVLPLKVIQKGKQRQLKKPTSLLQQTGILKSAKSGSANNSQIIKITNLKARVQDNPNVMLQRKVLPGESLLKKGLSNQKLQKTTSVPEVTVIPGLLSDRELIKRCPREHVEFAVNWLIKQFPLVNGKAGVEYYKTKHPYCAVDRVTFLKWPLAKQRAAEWMRAKKIKRLIGRVCPHLKPWSTLQIIDWARLRGFTPLGVSLKCNNLSIVNKDTSFSFTAADLSSILSTDEHVVEKEVDIEMDSEIKTEKIIKPKYTTEGRLYFPLQKKYQDIGDYIFKSCDNKGIHFYEEELTPGVVYPAVERVLISVFHSVADDLFRRSLSASCVRSGAMPATQVQLDDVKLALLSRDEFDIFTNEGLGTCINAHNNHIK